MRRFLYALFLLSTLTSTLFAQTNEVEGLKLPPDQTVAADEGFVVVNAETLTPSRRVKFLVVCNERVKFTTSASSLVVSVPPKPGTVIQIFAATSLNENEPTDFARTVITVGGSSPPTPGPVPSPAAVLEGPLTFSVIEDPSRRTPEVAALVTSPTLRESLKKSGHRLFVFDVRDAAIKQLKFDKAIEDAGNKVPVLIVQTKDGVVQPDKKALPLPATEADFLTLVKQLTGK